MAPASAVATWRLARLGLVVVLAALAGVVAILLVGAAPAPPAQHAGQLIVNLPPSVWGVLFLAPLLSVIAARVLMRIHDSGLVRSRRLVLQAVVALAIGVVFVVLFSLALPAGPSQVGVASAPAPSGGTSSAPTNNSTVPPSSGPASGASFLTLSLPSWWVLVLAGGLAVVVAVLALPGVLGSLLDRRGAGPGRGAVRERVQEALAQADQEIRRGDDPRESVIKLYLRLVTELGPRVGETATLTADEIHARIVSSLGVRPPASEALTRLFEVARYSTHALGADAVQSCRESIRLVRDDLARGAPAR
jgi:hypothetical protein